jgi:tape measure domain-containing protein
MAMTIKDFILQLGFDSSEVDKGLSNIEAKMGRIGAKAQRNQEARMKASKTFFADQLRQEERAAKAAERIQIRRNRVASSLEIARRKATRGLGVLGTPESKAQLSQFQQQFNQLSASIKKASTAGDFSRITNQLRLVNDQLTATVQRSNQASRAFKAQTFAMNSARDSARNLARSYLSVFAAVGVAGGVGRTGMGFESLRASLLAASGSTEQAAKDFEFVKETSMNLGRELTSSAKGFQQIAVSANNAGLSMEQTKEIFLAGSEASAAFGLSAEDTFGVFRAFTQILSKGTVTSEELKQQLGDRMPIALSTAAKAVGATIPELTKMLENGELISTEFLPKFAKQLRIAAREGGALQASLNTTRVALQRLSTSYQINISQAFDEGLGEGLTSFFNDLRITVDQLAPTFRSLGRIVGAALSGLGIAIRALTQIIRPFGILLDTATGSMQDLSDLSDDGVKELSLLGRAVRVLIGLFKILAGVIVLPFGILERALNKISGMEDGPLKGLLAIGTSLVTIFTGKKLFGLMKSGGLSAGKTFGKFFLKAFLLSFAFNIGTMIGDVINKSLEENFPNFMRGLSDFIGSLVDNIRALFGNEEAAARLRVTGAQASRTAMDRQRARQKRRAAAIGQVNINVNANGLDEEAATRVVENAIQNQLVPSMEAVQ